ncbi:hypothetical protein [Tengunoibacter tsumagoiensis]|uniref:Glucosyltransferase 3-like C-terminal domain-containing protein n=1 Tax=Tengunoibacter tsumagoiensis TaxID=2014871 RepID=A0A402A6K5_9CHLR|nr:hypothetical protein [Tengunoibacter tsumagoiensis]GCE14621.1 hypothetical protein KTT_44800 [Tengunoibacter tsumagoiensis]
MNILILGDLYTHVDRILALSEMGHTVVYCYTYFPKSLKKIEGTIPCYPLARYSFLEQIHHLVDKYEINVIYSGLHFFDGSLEATIELLDGGITVPIVRHYKEHRCSPTMKERRTLMETAGQIYINDESVEYFRDVYGINLWSTHVMDAELISREYMKETLTPKLSRVTGEPHILIAGNISMANDHQDVRELCLAMNKHRIHVHLYGIYHHQDEEHNIFIRPYAPTLQVYKRLADLYPYVHIHDYITPEEFTQEWSGYDAGFLHVPVPREHYYGRFEQLNMPCRYAAYLAAALPLAAHEGQTAMARFVKKNHLGLVYQSYDELAEQLHDTQHMESLTRSVEDKRYNFSFEAQAPHLIHILSQYARL